MSSRPEDDTASDLHAVAAGRPCGGPEPATVPVVVIGGYLGAGKTTLVNHLLRHAGGRRIAVLVNDFGELSIDADLIEGADGEVLSLAGGCVCCSFGADLVGTVNRLLERDPPPDVVVIETSGVGIPAAVARTARLAARARLDGIVTVCDASTVAERARDRYVGDTVRQQLDDADLVVINQADRVSEAALAGLQQALVQGQVSEQPRARVLTCERGRLPVDVVLGWRGQAGVAPAHAPAAARPDDQAADAPTGAMGRWAWRSSVSPADHRFTFETRTWDGPVDVDDLRAELAAADPPVLRAKGAVCDLQGRRRLLQVVGDRFEATEAPTSMALGRLVLIRLSAPHAEPPRSSPR